MTDAEPVRNEGYDDFLDAVSTGAGYFLSCPNDHGSLPPRRVCPHCGEAGLKETPLPESGSVVTHTVVHVPTPRFRDDAPYVTAIAEFGPVRLTGLLRGVDPDAVETGLSVVPSVEETATDGERLLTFRPEASI